MVRNYCIVHFQSFVINIDLEVIVVLVGIKLRYWFHCISNLDLKALNCYLLEEVILLLDFGFTFF